MPLFSIPGIERYFAEKNYRLDIPRLKLDEQRKTERQAGRTNRDTWNRIGSFPVNEIVYSLPFVGDPNLFLYEPPGCTCCSIEEGLISHEELLIIYLISRDDSIARAEIEKRFKHHLFIINDYLELIRSEAERFNC